MWFDTVYLTIPFIIHFRKYYSFILPSLAAKSKGADPSLPIEHYWFKIKHNIRKISHMFTDFSDAVCFILKNVSTFVY
ncbi:hypothetical protein [Wolbachia endosymbiont of Bemisia tabaci]|uniref:hypothetical protein n=1 Tax=Wolbachia endosymbiont of Bemisia tabaci TaxID=215173 RepID=UPI00131F3F4C|nr:hypothetical protein [Wolbachia endosymbiont of Bemisia tabaci]